VRPLESKEPEELIPEASPTPAEPGEEPSRRRFVIIRVALAALVLSVLTPIALWIGYRTSYVVARQAIVRGHIAQVGSLVDGLVTSVEVLEGDRVEAGQILVRLDEYRYRANVDRAKSRLERAKLNLEVEQLAIAVDDKRKGSSVQKALASVAAARAELKSAESRAEGAKATRDQRAKLSGEGALPSDELRDSETRLADTKAQAEAARAELIASYASLRRAEIEYEGIAVTRERIRVLEVEVAQREAELEAAQERLDATIIRAPSAGAVVRRIVEPGTSIEVGRALVDLWTGDSLWVEAWVDEEDLEHIEIGGKAKMEINSFPERQYTGTITSMSVATDFELPDSAVPRPRAQRMRPDPVVAVRIKFDQSVAELFPGLSAEAAIKKTR